MVVVGSYAQETLLDVNVMIIMGLIGYFFNRIRLPVTPIVLGLVLGRTIEQEYRNGYVIVSRRSFYFLVL